MHRPDKPIVAVIEPLRALAALAVMYMHFTYGTRFLDNATGVMALVRASGEPGLLGVQVFFVISGFILPYALHRSGYSLRAHYATFLAKRIIRLDPPYLATVALALALWYAASQVSIYDGEPFALDPVRLLLHGAYLINFVEGYDWYVGVFWTLGVEFQYYILVGLLFPLIAHQRQAVRTVAPLLLASLALTTESIVYVTHWLGLFALGMVTFQLYASLLSRRSYILLLTVISAVNLVALPWPEATVGLATALIIAFVQVPRLRLFTALSAISYSLYLVHSPVGSRVLGLGTRFATSAPLQVAVILLATVLSLIAAYALYRLVERPALKWSQGIRYARSARSARQKFAR